MRVTRFFTGPDDETHFEELEIPVTMRGVVGASARIPAVDTMIVAVDSPVEEARGYHNAPQRQFVVMLSGVHEVKAASGEYRRWGPGELFMPDDTTGHGHLTTVIEPPVRYLFVKLPDDFDPAPYRVAMEVQ
jgi:hypothetical protein